MRCVTPDCCIMCIPPGVAVRCNNPSIRLRDHCCEAMDGVEGVVCVDSTSDWSMPYLVFRLFARISRRNPTSRISTATVSTTSTRISSSKRNRRKRRRGSEMQGRGSTRTAREARTLRESSTVAVRPTTTTMLALLSRRPVAASLLETSPS
jgi:hypothetical protein